MKKVIIILLCLFLLTACDTHQDMNELGIVSALGIEYVDDEFLVSAQLVKIKKSTENGTDSSSNVLVFKESGKTMFEALRKITTKSSKKLYFAHMKIIIFDDSVLNGKENEIIDFLTRDSESMINYYVLVTTDDSPSDIIETITPFEDVPAQYILKLLKTSEKSYGNTYSLSFENFIDNLVTVGKNPSFTQISLINSDDKDKNSVDSLKTTTSEYIKLGNILVYDDKNKLKELSLEESLSFNILNNNVINAIISLPCDKNYYTSEIISSKTKMKFKKDREELTLNTEIKLSISDYFCDYDLLKESTISKLEKQVKEYLENINNNLLQNSQKYNNDFIGIGLFIKSRYKDYFDFKNDDWNKIGLNKLKLKSVVSVNFEKRGNVLNLVKEKGE